MNVSSRSVHTAVSLALGLMLTGWNAARAQQPAETTTPSEVPELKLVFIGDRAGHRPEQRANALIPVMRKRGIEIEYTEDVDVLASPKLQEYDGVILYANIVRITPEQEAGLLAFVEGGKGFVPLHCASFCFQNSEKVIALIGAQFARHGGEVFSTRLVEPEHPIMKGFGGFESWDETYVHRMHNEQDRVVLEYRDQGMQARGQASEPWTWVRTHGKGRVFYTAWGHDLRTWNNPGFQNLVERGIRWACGRDPGVVPAFVKPPAGSQQPDDAAEDDAQPRRRRGRRRNADADGGQGRQEPAEASQSETLTQNFVPPRMVEGGGDMDALEYDDVGPAVPIYNPQQRGGDARGPRGGGLEHHSMQRPLSPEASKTYYMTPEGFSLELYAAEPELGPKPISMAWDARGRLWVGETTDYPNEWKSSGEGNDRIRICEDVDGDGKADKYTVFAENLSIPYAIAFYRGGAIVQNGGTTIYLKDADGDDRADVRKTLITGWSMRDTHGTVSNFQYGIDNWIWAMQGYNGSSPRYVDAQGVEHEGPRFSQGFFRFKLDQNEPPSVVEIEFLRSTSNNTWGLGITEEGLVFGSTANGNPSVFMPIPNRYYERVRGWSGETLRMIADTARFSSITDKVRQVDNFGAYTAGAGHAVYTARTYPQQWWNKTAFVCEPTGHLVGTFVLERDGAGYRSSSPMNLVASRDEWAAPIMAEVGPDGNVWILDWYNYIVQHNPTPPGFETGVGAAYETELRDKKHGRVYRLKYVGDNSAPIAAQPKLDGATPEELVAALRHPTKLWRLHAQRLLVERGQLDVAPALIELVKDAAVDAIGMNVGAIHALGVLGGLGTFDGEQASARTVDALYAALKHPSPGVRRIAIQSLPVNEASRDALLASNALRDSDAQVQLAAALALSDLPPCRQTADAIVALLKDGAAEDRWMAEALTSAAAMHGVEFVQVLAAAYPREADSDAAQAEAVAQMSSIVGEHLARGGLDAPQLAALLSALASANSRISFPAVAALSEFWPDDLSVQLPSAVDSALAQLLDDAPFEARSDLLRLARLWNAGNTEELQKEHADALRARVENVQSPDEERIAAAQAWVRFDPDSGEVGSAIVGAITPQTPLPLLVGLLEAAADGAGEDFAQELIDLHGILSPQGRQTVLNQLLSKPETTAALLDAFAASTIDPAGLTLEQIAALRAHANEAIRKRSTELLASRGSTPDPERQKILAELLVVADAPGDAVLGKELFTKHCSTCHMHSGVGGAIGPELTGMFVHPKKDILGNIIDPSRDVESNFRSYSVIANGKAYSGMFAGESRTNVTVVDSTGKRVVIQRDEIEEIYASEKSLMPDGFEQLLSHADLSNVLEFLATPQRYVPLRLSSVGTVTSAPQQFGGPFGRQAGGQQRRRGFGDQEARGGPQRGGANQVGGRGPGAGQGRNQLAGRGRGDGRGRGNRGFGGFRLIQLEEWKPVTVNGIPFTLVDPQEGAVKNVLILGDESSRFWRDLPKSVRLPCGMRAKTLHLLSGVSLGGYPDRAEQSTSLKVRLHYEGGDTEDHDLKNGVHFAAIQRREDVPGSEFAFAMDDQQMRHVKVTPARADVIVDVEFIKGDDPTTPIVLAATAEVP